MRHTKLLLNVAVVAGIGASTAVAQQESQVGDQLSRSGFVLENGLQIPAFDPVKGRTLFVSKGCVVCHGINGVGGEDAPDLSASHMERPMNAFGFAAKMWRGAPAMIAMQEDEMGEQIDLTGDELAAIIAFVHDTKEQAKFSEADIPKEIMEILEGDHD